MDFRPTKILVVDDSALYRQSINNVLREVDQVTVVGTAKDGIEALAKIEELDPDLLTLDVQMPDMNGIQVLNEIKKRRLRPKAIMVSSLTSEGAKVTTDALLQGAFDFILKPSSGDSAANRQELLEALTAKLGAFRDASQTAKTMRRVVVSTENRDSGSIPTADAACRAVVIGTSTGGPEALRFVLPRLDEHFPVPVLVVQHMPPQYTHSLAARLNEICQVDVREAVNGSPAIGGQVLIAPGGKQMRLRETDKGLIVSVNDDAPENGVRPSVDYLLRSATKALDGNLLAVILTGMGQDGKAACEGLKQAGGYVFVQSQDDCVVYGMPKAVAEAGLADRVLPLGRIAPAIARHLKRSLRS